MPSTSEAYILVTIPSVTLTSSSSGTLTNQQLALEYVTFDIPASATTSATASSVQRDVLLILRIGNGTFEEPLDPSRALTASVLPSGARRYVFDPTRDDVGFTLEIPVTAETADDVELFHNVLVGYAGRGTTDHLRAPSPGRGEAQVAIVPGACVEEVGEAEAAGPEEEDLRGRFVLMNEDNGEIVGALDRSVRVREDPSIAEKGHESDPVVVELPEGADTADGLRDVEVLVRTVPPEDRDWMLKGAVFVSASARPAPSPRASSPVRDTQPPSRTLLLLQSPTTHKHLTRIHAVSSGAVKLSSKAATTVESLIQRAGGGNASASGDRAKGKGKSRLPAFAVPTPQPATSTTGVKPPLLPRSRGPSPALPDNKPPPQPRHGKSPQSPSPSDSRALSPTSLAQQPPPPLRARIALSAAVILASLEASSIQLVEAGGTAISAAVSHKYGATAGENAVLAVRTVRNVVLVYVDMRGLGRQTVMKRVTKSWVKGRVPSAARR
ncbi:hypothetical protein BJV74DRAFT_928258 [Russula compacta]|nr:hypothetical protein BJV74DRAFT_928258 [Russula compacta]